MRRFISCISIILLFFVLNPIYGQKSNRPDFLRSGKEPLGERDNSFSTGRGHGISSFFKSFTRKKGFEHVKKTQHFGTPSKKNRSSFAKKQYGKKGFLSFLRPGGSNGWGGRARKGNGREDKRLFKAPKNKSKGHKIKLLKKNR